MANDSTGMGPASSEQDATPINDGYFTDMQGDEDALEAMLEKLMRRRKHVIDLVSACSVGRVKPFPNWK